MRILQRNLAIRYCMSKCYAKDTAYNDEYCNSEDTGTRSKELQIFYLGQRNRDTGMFPVCVLTSCLSTSEGREGRRGSGRTRIHDHRRTFSLGFKLSGV